MIHKQDVCKSQQLENQSKVEHEIIAECGPFKLIYYLGHAVKPHKEETGHG